MIGGRVQIVIGDPLASSNNLDGRIPRTTVVYRLKPGSSADRLFDFVCVGGCYESLGLSNDGALLAYDAIDGLRIRRLGDGDDRVLAPSDRSARNYRSRGNPSWSADGRWVSFDYSGEAVTQGAIEVATGREHRIGNQTVPRWSPTGASICEGTVTGRDGQILQPDSGQSVTIANINNSSNFHHFTACAWAPDGRVAMGFSAGIRILAPDFTATSEMYGVGIPAAWAADGKTLITWDPVEPRKYLPRVHRQLRSDGTTAPISLCQNDVLLAVLPE